MTRPTSRDLYYDRMNPEPPRKFAARPTFTIEKRRARDALRPYVCAAILLAEATLLTYHRAGTGRLNRLMPFSGQTSYVIGGSVDNIALDAAGVRQRYGLEAEGTLAGSPDDLRTILQQREQQRDDDKTVYLRLHTRRNGGAEEIWLWPQQ